MYQDHPGRYYDNVRNEKKLADRIMLGLDGYDTGFAQKVSAIFEIDQWLDRDRSPMLRSWISQAVREIIDMFSIGPGSMMINLNLGPDLGRDLDDPAEFKYYPGMSAFEQDKVDEFVLAYKALAVNIYHCLNSRLQPYIQEAFELGYQDIACSVFRYLPGVIVLNVRAISPYPDTP